MAMTPAQMQRAMALSGLSSGLMGLGGGLMSAGMGNRQGIQQGMQSFGQSMDPMKMMQAQYMQQQMAQMEAKRKQTEAQRAAYQGLLGGAKPSPYAAMASASRPGPSAEAASTLAAPASSGIMSSLTPEQRAVLQAADPKTGFGILADQAFKEPTAPKTVTAYDEATGRAQTRKWDQALGRFVPVGGTKRPDILDPAVQAARKSIAQAGASKMSVTQVSETEQAKKLGGHYADEFIRTQEAATSAREQNSRMDAMEQLFDKTYTGAFAGTLQEARKIASALGVEGLEGAIAAGEAGQAIADEQALQLRNPAGGAGLPGAVSDRDREFLKGMTGGIATTKEGRRLMFETRRRLNQRSIDIAQDARDYMKEKGSMDQGFYGRLREKYSDNLFGDLYGRAESLSGGEGVSKTVTSGGKKYIKVGDEWFEAD